MNIDRLNQLFETHKEPQLYHRYITNNHILPLLKKLEGKIQMERIGTSVLKKPIYGVQLGTGDKRLLFWSQMHGNESTTTKALFDVLHTLTSEIAALDHVLKTCTLYIIPILNPDGAEAYTRLNANSVDLNRDAQRLSQPESTVLRQVFTDFKPHYCYNLHGQRTIFSAGNSNYPATVSFLSPAQDDTCSLTTNRKMAMEVIAHMNHTLQEVIPNQVGVYDDAFNINCVGDTFQSFHVPTILFEAGHYNNDYAREKTRAFIYMALLQSIDYISKTDIDGTRYKAYFDIPENKKNFFDVIIRNARFNVDNEATISDIGIMYQEILVNDVIEFIPKVEKIDNLQGFYGHKEIDANGHDVLSENKLPLAIGYENVFVITNNKKISLLFA